MPSAQAIRAGAAYVELYTKDSRLVRGLARASKRLQAFGASVRAMGLRMAAAGTAMLAPLLGAAKLFASTGDQLDKMRARVPRFRSSRITRKLVNTAIHVRNEQGPLVVTNGPNSFRDGLCNPTEWRRLPGLATGLT